MDKKKIKTKYTLVVIVLTIFVCGYIFSSVTSNTNIVKADATQTEQPVKLLIVLYHETKINNLNKMSITPYEFESDLKYLAANGYTSITMSKLINYVYNGEALPEKPIMLAFDDGYLSNYVYAYPLLKKYDMKAVLSIIAKDTDSFSNCHDTNIDYAHSTWLQLNEMVKSGCIELQNHSYNLHCITTKRYGCKRALGESKADYEKVLSDDLDRCSSEIFENTGQISEAFAYPYGSIDELSLPIIKKLGIKATMTCKYGVNKITHNPEKLYGLKRITRYHNTSIKKLITDSEKIK